MRGFLSFSQKTVLSLPKVMSTVSCPPSYSLEWRTVRVDPSQVGLVSQQRNKLAQWMYQVRSNSSIAINMLYMNSLLPVDYYHGSMYHWKDNSHELCMISGSYSNQSRSSASRDGRVWDLMSWQQWGSGARACEPGQYYRP
jgi:hypothetical protein